MSFSKWYVVPDTKDGHEIRTSRDGFEALICSTHHFGDDNLAAARLIAAAPELLDALKSLRSLRTTIECMGEWSALDRNRGLYKKNEALVNEAMRIVGEVIAKVEGRS